MTGAYDRKDEPVEEQSSTGEVPPPAKSESPFGSDEKIAPSSSEESSSTADPEAEEEGGGESLEDLIEKDLTVVAAERDEYLDSLRRLQADFDNYRKRALRQQTDLLERAAEGVLVSLLPVLDALDLAEAHAAPEAEDALSQVGSLLRSTLERQGLERIDAIGVAFDPTMHDAVRSSSRLRLRASVSLPASFSFTSLRAASTDSRSFSGTLSPCSRRSFSVW